MKTEMQLSGALTKVWWNMRYFGSNRSVYLGACLRLVASIYEIDINSVAEEYAKVEKQLSK